MLVAAAQVKSAAEAAMPAEIAAALNVGKISVCCAYRPRIS